MIFCSFNHCSRKNSRHSGSRRCHASIYIFCKNGSVINDAKRLGVDRTSVPHHTEIASVFSMVPAFKQHTFKNVEDYDCTDYLFLYNSQHLTMCCSLQNIVKITKLYHRTAGCVSSCIKAENFKYTGNVAG